MHCWADYDGLTAAKVLKIKGRGKIPGIENAEETTWDGNPETAPASNAIFVDCSPGFNPDLTKGLLILDHHPHTDFPWKLESANDWERYHTATSRVIEFLGLDTSDPKIADLIRMAFRADYKSNGDTMSIDNIVKEMHLFCSEEKVSQWFEIAILAHFNTPEKLESSELQKGIEFFKKLLAEFLSKNKDSLGKKMLQRWQDRKLIEDKMNVAYQAAVILTAFGLEKTQDWVEKIFNTIQKGQEIFWAAEKQFDRAEKMLLGKWALIISDEPDPNPRFNRFCRSSYAKAKMPRPLSEREDPIVVQFQQNKGFQVFTNGSGYKLWDVVKALRAVILKTRNKIIPLDWQTLQCEGTLEGTDPLYYQQGNYEVLMWSSLTAPGVKPLDVSKEALRRTIIIAVDQNFYPEDCTECIEKKCPIFTWKLLRCTRKRKDNHKNSFL